MKIQEYSHLNILLNIPEFLEKNFHIKKKKRFYKNESVCLWLGGHNSVKALFNKNE